jgi:hypothetical protein
MTLPATLSASVQLPTLITASGDRASWRFMEFFTAAIRYGEQKCDRNPATSPDAGAIEITA